MGTEKSEVAYCPIDISIGQNEVEAVINEISNLPRFYSLYRTCEMIPLFTPGGLEDRTEIRKSKESLKWTPSAHRCSSAVNLIESKFFSFMSPLPRVLVLCSVPNGEVRVHVDCGRQDSEKQQHKVRLVLSGSIGGLWFMSRQKTRVHISDKHRVYMIDGSRPHGMVNHCDKPKLTLCFGSPWRGLNNPEYDVLLEKSLKKYKSEVIHGRDLLSANEFDFYQEEVEGRFSITGDNRLSALEIPIKP